jgi:hypothetical protein
MRRRTLTVTIIRTKATQQQEMSPWPADLRPNLGVEADNVYEVPSVLEDGRCNHLQKPTWLNIRCVLRG